CTSHLTLLSIVATDMHRCWICSFRCARAVINREAHPSRNSVSASIGPINVEKVCRAAVDLTVEPDAVVVLAHDSIERTQQGYPLQMDVERLLGRKRARWHPGEA